MPSQPYVLIGDLVESRRIVDRPAFERLIDHELESLHERYAEEFRWMAPLKRVLGIDEIAGVLRNPWRVFDIAVGINLAIWPQRFRFALATGAIDIGLDQHDVAKMDGPAFHQAADALQRARDNGLGFVLAIPERSVQACRLAEALADLHHLIVANWTRREAQAVRAFRSFGTQAIAAKHLDISQQAVSDALRRARAHHLDMAEDAVRQWFGGLAPR